MLGYRENTAGYKVYVPESGTTRFVADARVDESVMFKDRCDVQPELSYDDWGDGDLGEGNTSSECAFSSVMDVNATTNTADERRDLDDEFTEIIHMYHTTNIPLIFKCVGRMDHQSFMRKEELNGQNLRSNMRHFLL